MCVRSDQQQPFIARIDRMWTDAEYVLFYTLDFLVVQSLSLSLSLSPSLSNDPWFHGPWFVRIEETQHLPTRMFYERELFMSNIHDTNPMRSIIRKCAVLFPSDYVKSKTCCHDNKINTSTHALEESSNFCLKCVQLKCWRPMCLSVKASIMRLTSH